jgi:DNA repair photolyase
MQRDLRFLIHSPDPFWPHPLTVERTGFKNKALGAFHVNLAIGCSHGCRFCYVPSVSTVKQARALRKMGTSHPMFGWGGYLYPRIWDEHAFRLSLRKAMRTPDRELLPDGNRAVFYCSTTDAFQVSRHPDSNVRRFHQDQMDLLFRRSLEIIRDESDLRVRILTRSPLAASHFDLMKTLGDRLLFGMSIPSLDDELVRLYEPQAPGVTKRLECLRKAKDVGLHVYAAVAPTFPEQGIEDFRKILTVINSLDPVTVFHEPVNVRGGNVDLMAHEFRNEGLEFPGEIFRNRKRWAVYAARSLTEFEDAARDIGLEDRLKLWPDADLQHEDAVQAVVESGLFADESEFKTWIEAHWARPSAWPNSESLGNGLH